MNYGRYGGYINCGDKNASLEDNSEIFDIGINEQFLTNAQYKPGDLKVHRKSKL